MCTLHTCPLKPVPLGSQELILMAAVGVPCGSGSVGSKVKGQQ